MNIKARVLIVNTIGHLSRIYAHGDLAYVGGGIGHSGLQYFRARCIWIADNDRSDYKFIP